MKFKTPNKLHDRNTPIVIIDREQGPTGTYLIAPFLPLVRYVDVYEEYVVLNAGKVVSYFTSTESGKEDLMLIVPAGLKKDIEQALADGDTSNCVNRYTLLDVQEGVLNYAGNPVTAGEAVVESMIDFSTSPATVKVAISDPIGVLQYNAMRSAYDSLTSILSDANALNYRYGNYNVQHQVAYTRDAEMELPIVKNDSRNTFKMPGLTCLAVNPSWTRTDKTALYGAYLTYDAYSDFVLADPATAPMPDIIGRVYFVLDTQTEMPVNMTDWIKSAPDTSVIPDSLKVTSDATGGLDHSIWFTNALGKAYIHFEVK